MISGSIETNLNLEITVPWVTHLVLLAYEISTDLSVGSTVLLIYFTSMIKASRTSECISGANLGDHGTTGVDMKFKVEG